MSIISAGTTSGTALVQTADTNGNLVIKTGASGTTAMTVGANQVTDFAATPTINGGAFPAGAFNLISTQNASGSANIQWTGLSGYTSYYIYARGINPSGGWGPQLGTGSTPTWQTSGYTGGYIYGGFGAGAQASGNNSSASDLFASNWSGTPSSVSGTIFISGNDFYLTQAVGTFTNTNGGQGVYGGILNIGFSTVTAIRLNCSSGNFNGGTFSLYGITS